ncbi:hypothetical protein N7445_010034 [Penicillium cf. griseofulvum]|nr:hypothetical protein N7445_010034 [Penicillium cf. griseofulvum]
MSISQDSKVSPDATNPKAGDFDATHVFEDVIQNFQNSLSSQEKSIFKEFHNPRDMLHDLQTKCKEVRNGRKLSKLCHVIERFASAWEPFFEVTSIFVQTHPEFAGIAWGAIRLVFLLGTNYTVHLEKLVTMIQRIGEMLPSYEEYFNIFVRRKKTLEEDTGSAMTLELRHHRLQKALSFVYADIVQFCQDACSLFGSKRGGTRYKPSLIADVFWKPFDSRFASLIDRMRAHQEGFKTEMQLEESKYLEFMSERQARQSSLMGKALEQIQAQAAELRQSNIDLDSKLSSQLDRLIQEKHSSHHRSGRHDSEEKEALLAKAAQVKAWVAAPDYMREYEKSRRIRLPETGTYLLDNPIYKQWRNKTKNHDVLAPDMTAPVLPNLLIVKVLMDSDGSGQATASDEEVLAGLSLILATVPQTFTVFDGIDECDDHEHFLELIRDISTQTSHKVLLLGRPNVEAPSKMHHLSLYLDQAWNFPDIKLYLYPKILSLQERHQIPDTLDIEGVVGVLAHRAEGMFLWAWLMIQYLNCRALSPKERLDAVLTPSIVEGLEDVYEKILSVLDRGYRKEKGQILKIFEILTAALRPVSVSELEFAIAITPGTVTEASSIIVDFETTLPVISCSLVEVGCDERVRFAHSSFRDFITSHDERQSDSPFAVNERRAHLSLSTVSLSYILHDLPSSSVCQAASSAVADHVAEIFPFAAYAHHWPQHAIQGLRAKASKSVPTSEIDAQDNLFGILTKFFNHPLSVTAWIETSWLFQSEPSLTALADVCSETILPGPQSFLETGSIALTMLREASSNLDDLKAEWNHLLRNDPQAIWGPSITAFSTSPYWYQTEETIVSSMLPIEATGSYQKGSAHWSILVQSQLSSSGIDFGVVIMIPSR